MRFIFSGLDNFKNHHRDYFSSCSDLINVCNVSPDQQICNELVTSDFNAFSGNSLVDRKLCSTIVPIVDELNQGGSLSL